MWGKQLLRDIKIVHVPVDGTNYGLSAGTSDVNTGVVDTDGYNGILWLVTLGTLAASGSVTIKAQQGEASNLSDAADLAGTSQATTMDTDDDKMLSLDIAGMRERYHRLAITRGDGGNSTIQSVHAILYNPDVVPVTQAITAGQFCGLPEFFQEVAEGTA